MHPVGRGEEGRGATQGRDRGWIRPLFAIDLRALAGFRIALATIVLADLASRSLDLRAHYTDDGLMPRAHLNPWASETLVPLHLPSGELWYQALLFAVAAGFALMLALGFHTRVAAVVCWALNLSLWARNPAVCGYADTLLRALLFWSMFLPLGAVVSLDARRRGPPREREPLLSVAGVALMLQVAFVYFFTALHKSGPDWRVDFSAIHYALHQDWYLRPLGAWLAGSPELLRLLTAGTIVFEIVGPLLLFCPVQTARLRMLLVLAFWAFQAGLGLTIVLDHFPWLSGAMMLVFLPPRVWDRMEAWLRRRCPPARESDCAPAATAASTVSTSAAPLRLARDAAVALALLYVLAFNVAGAYRELPFPKWLARAGHWVGLNQHWGMYAPNVSRYDGWYVIPATLRDGSRVNLWHDGPALDWEKPDRIADLHRSVRMAAYEFKLSRPDYDEPGYTIHRERYAHWLCRRWNARHPRDEWVESLEIWFVLEPTPPAGVEPRVKRRLLHSHVCATPDGSAELADR